MRILPNRNNLSAILIFLFIVFWLVGCYGSETKDSAKVALLTPAQELSTAQPVKPTINPFVTAISNPTPTLFNLAPLFDPKIDLWDGPVDVPLELQIPSINVTAPVLGVGLTEGNVMDSPRAEIGNSVWHSAFWYRGSDNPGEPGTAAIAGHVNDPLGRPEIFAKLDELKPGDLIIIRIKNTPTNMIFIINEVTNYTIKESSDPSILKQIYGEKAVTGKVSKQSQEGPANLSLITCAGNIVDGQFDNHTVVYATRSK